MPWQFNAEANSRLEFRQQLGNCPQLSSLYPTGISENSDEAVHSVACDPFGNPMRVNDLRIVDYDPEFIFLQTAYTCDGTGNSADCSFGTGFRSVTQMEFEAKLNHSGYHLDGRRWTVGEMNTSIHCRRNLSGVCTSWHIPNIDINPTTDLEEINPESDLGLMIRYGLNRHTDPGIQDANIMLEMSEWGPSWVSWIPIAGDIQGAVEAVRAGAALETGWVDGQVYCDGCRPSWITRYRWLNQYIVDMSLYEGMGSVERSTVSAFFDRHIYPTLDWSPAGVLARSMGMPKAWVEQTMIFAEDLFNTPQNIYAKIASAPNIWFNHYGGDNFNIPQVPEQSTYQRILANSQEGTRIAGAEARRRMNGFGVVV
jgi:hypothetical protein